MAVLQGSPWYNKILSRGQTLGIQQGLQQGIEQEKCMVIARLWAKDFSVSEIAEIVGDAVEVVTTIIQENQGRSPSN